MATDQIPHQYISYKFRLLPNRKQHNDLARILEEQRQLYNGALEHRIEAYRKAAKSISLYSQIRELTALGKDPDFSQVPVNIQRWTLRRIDAVYQAFFRRVKRREKAGFTRFRGNGRWQSFGFAEFSGITIKGQTVFALMVSREHSSPSSSDATREQASFLHIH